MIPEILFEVEIFSNTNGDTIVCLGSENNSAYMTPVESYEDIGKVIVDYVKSQQK